MPSINKIIAIILLNVFNEELGKGNTEIKDHNSNKSLALLLVIFTKKHPSLVSTSIHADIASRHTTYVPPYFLPSNNFDKF